MFVDVNVLAWSQKEQNKIASTDVYSALKVYQAFSTGVYMESYKMQK